MSSVIDWYLSLDSQLVVTSPFGWRDLDGDGIDEDFHQGTDLAHLGGSPTGFPTPVPSLSEITQVGWDPDGYGNFVRFWQVGADYHILIAHLDFVSVFQGEFVQAGKFVGGMGSTGNSTGNHWHIEVIDFNNNRLDGQTVPLYLPDKPPTPESEPLKIMLGRRFLPRRRK